MDSVYINAMLVIGGLGFLLTVLLMIAERFLCNYGQCEIRVNDEKKFEVQGGCSLLDALYENKIFIPSACGGQGTCGYCKVRVLTGAGVTLPTELPFLTEDEIANSTRLACQVKVKKNMQIRVREDFLSVQEFAGKVVHAKMLTPDTREIRIALTEPATMNYKPGQYVQVDIPHPAERIFRAYSICSAPSNAGEIELLVKRIPDGLGSTYLHELQVGQQVSLTGPFGEFELDSDAEIICVGGGLWHGTDAVDCTACSNGESFAKRLAFLRRAHSRRCHLL